MKRIIQGLCVLSLLLSSLAQSAEGPKKSEDGVFVEIVATHQSMGRLIYVADSVAELCFVTVSTSDKPLTAIPCENLAKRPEWKPIITWALK